MTDHTTELREQIAQICKLHGVPEAALKENKGDN